MTENLAAGLSKPPNCEGETTNEKEQRSIKATCLWLCKILAILVTSMLFAGIVMSVNAAEFAPGEILITVELAVPMFEREDIV